MSKEIMRAYCADRLITGVMSQFPAMMFKMENRRFDQPKDGSPFIEMTLDETGAGFASTGASRRFYRINELLSFVINWPENSGTRDIGLCAEYLKDLFQGRSVSLAGDVFVTFRVGRTVTQGLSNGFYRMVVLIPCWRDVSKPPPS